jgi:hypothetical protein
MNLVCRNCTTVEFVNLAAVAGKFRPYCMRCQCLFPLEDVILPAPSVVDSAEEFAQLFAETLATVIANRPERSSRC